MEMIGDMRGAIPSGTAGRQVDPMWCRRGKAKYEMLLF